MILSSGAVRRCVNVQDDLDRIEASPIGRDARTAFVLAAEDQYFLATSQDTDDPVAIIYHSHPTGGLAFSSQDVTGATWHGHPIYPDVDHLVLDCSGGMARASALFRLDCQCPIRIGSWRLSAEGA